MQWTLLLADLAAVSAIAPRLPALETLLARAHAHGAPQGGVMGVLADRFSLPAETLMAAPFTRLADTGARDNSFYFRADPVHLAADRDQLVMLPLAVLQVQAEEARAFSETFNRTYAAQGYHLETPHPERWYLRVPTPFRCVTHDPAGVAGQPVFEFMPDGEHGQSLRRFMNEVQMLFFEHPVNQAREAAGRPAINSLWLWGGGRLPETPATGPGRVWTDRPLIAGLARFAGSDCLAWPCRLDTSSGPEKQLIAVNCTTPTEIVQVEEQIAAALLHGLRKRHVSEILIYPGNQCCYRVTPASLRRFWRRRRPLPEILGTA